MNSFTINKLKQNELRTIGHFTGYICVIIGLFMFVPIISALIFNDSPHYLHSFITSSIISIVAGLILFSVFKRKDITQLSLKGSLIFVLSIWGITALICGLPYYISGDLGAIDAYFEGMSGITTTGFSMLAGTRYPYSIAIWEALTQWFGGLGIIVLLLVVIPSSSSLKRLYFSEGKTEQMTPNLKHTTMIYIKLYLILTTIGICLYLLAGLEPFDALCYCFCGIATGGFSIYPNSVMYFNSPLIEAVTIIVMLMGSTNFIILYRIVKRDFNNVHKDAEIKAMATIIIFATLFISLSLYVNGNYNYDVITIFRHALFQVVSVLSSTGFTSTSINFWSPFCYHILILLMFIGGSVCSTSGGIKIYNVVILLKSIWWEVEEMLLPKNAIIVKKVYHDNKYRDISNSVIKSTLIYVVSYIFIFIISALIILIFCNDFQASYTLAAASLGNTGIDPGYLSIHSPIIVKLVMIIDFWVGRIGIWPLLLMIVYFINMAQGKYEEIRGE